MTRDELIALLRENMDTFRKEYGVKRLGIFGSYSRNQQTEHSDVDVYAEFGRPIGLRFMAFTESLEKAIGARADVVTPAGVNGIRNRRISKSIRESIVYV
jgi:predicted nucleotidyltransferase